jgi:hypothetical protein
MENKRRKATVMKTETDVLARSRHRCALCFGLYRDPAVKQGQIAHVDHNRANAAYENLVFLCLPHHDQYDSSTSQSKNFGPGEVRRYRTELDKYLKQEKVTPWPDFAPREPVARGAGSPGALVEPSRPDVYDRRIVVYRALRSFVLAAVRNATVSLADLGQFAEATDEALFVLGPEVSEYLWQVYRKGVRLHYTSGRIRDERLSPREDHSAVIEENTDVLNWFSQQLEASRVVFASVLRLG